MIEHSQETKKAYILSVHPKSGNLDATLDSIQEMHSLAETLGFEIYGEEYQIRSHPDPKSYLGAGKLLEVKENITDKKLADLILFDHDLSPNQGAYLEKFFDCLVLDRTQLILEIFANHAQTPESKNQVELAQLKYMLPRLVGLWAHLDREKGGIGTSKGTGEKQISIDRHLVRKRIIHLEKALTRVDRERKIQAKKRNQCFQVGIVGYTNAGKTSLMNGLTGTQLKTQDQLFATLESTTRVLEWDMIPKIVISDTVGFIRNLPHNLVASFRSTLSVVKNADLLLHVVDSSSPSIPQHILTTNKVLKEIGAGHLPYLLVFNKADRIDNGKELLDRYQTEKNIILTSIRRPETIIKLGNQIKEYFYKDFVHQQIVLSYNRAHLLDNFYQLSTVKKINYEDDGIKLEYAATPTNHKILTASL